MKSTRLFAAALLAMTMAVAACGSDEESTGTTSVIPTDPPPTEPPLSEAPPTQPPANDAVLTISDSTFGALTVGAGAPFTITNSDAFPHTVTADDGSFDAEAPGSESVTLVIPAAGTYAIHCNIHPAMTGSIVVT